MKTLNVFDQQRADEVLRLEIAYSNLYNAYVSNCKESMIIAIFSTLSNNPFHISSLQKGMDDIFIEHYGANFTKMSWELLSLDDTKLNVEGCMSAIVNELTRINYYKDNYTYALNILYQPNHTFRQDEILYQNQQGQQFRVSDLLDVLKYAVGIAEAIEPSSKEYTKARAVISVVKGIDAILNNNPKDKPVNKMLHLLTSFLSSIVKSTIKDDEAKRGVTTIALVVELAIDFFCKE